MKKTGILLFAHGARDPAWAKPFEAVAHVLKQRAQGQEIRLAFLEFMSPSIMEAGLDLIDQGCNHITVVPLFLGAGGHVRKDLPRLIDELKAKNPEVTWTLSPAVGETDILIQALADAAWALAQPDTAGQG
ncbi:MAG: CbiX/SirB N-terminal domain-containing protein [Aquabacterium sp.]|nr:CbiX/SirB N-terminal domain-containing protein [Aquabacterium sp.]